MRRRNKCPNSAAPVVAARAQQDFPASPDTGSRIRQVPAQSHTCRRAILSLLTMQSQRELENPPCQFFR
jgi:hypothetical protein